MATLTVKVDDQLLEKLNQTAAALHRSRSEVVRAALEGFISAQMRSMRERTLRQAVEALRQDQDYRRFVEAWSALEEPLGEEALEGWIALEPTDG